MNSRLKLLLFILPALGGALYLYWRLSPEQAVMRRADVLFTSLEKGTLSTGTSKEKAEQFRQVLAPKLELSAPSPIPSGPITATLAANLLQEFQDVITSCTISREDEAVAFPSDDRAVYQATITAQIAQGPSLKYQQRYRCHFEFEKAERDWILTSIVLSGL